MWWWWCVVALAFVQMSTEGRKQAPLLQEEDGARKNLIRAAECTFGGQPRELGSTWFADLGPPFGVMYCIKCECVRVQKKRRMVAKVQCRNIKHECPKPTCDEPVLHEGRCCKVCPGDINSPDTPQDVPQISTAEEEERDARHFAALLLGKGHSPVAARFVLRRRSLYYTLEGVSSMDTPKTLQIQDSTGTTLQEMPLGEARLAERTCGVWRRLPRDYRRLLREGHLSAHLVWADDGDPGISGQIITHKALSTEMFSSLMEVEPGYGSLTSGWGATAAISTSAGAAPSLHITLIFTGVLPHDENKNSSVVITLDKLDKNTTILEEDHLIHKPKELNIVELKSPVSVADLRLLARGRLGLSVKSGRLNSNGHMPLIRGIVLPRMTCEHFFAPLSANYNSKKVVTTASSGAAWFHLSRDGELEYTVQVDELNMMDAPMITILDESNKHHFELESLTPFVGGKAVGSLNKMGPKILEPLYSGNLVVNVATHSDESIVRGKLISRPISDVMDLYGPTLLKRPYLNTPAEIVGLAWISVDYECSIQWEVMITGPGWTNVKAPNLELWLEMRRYNASGAPIHAQKIGTLECGIKTAMHTEEGAMMSSTHTDLQLLNSGFSELVVREPKTNMPILKALLRQMKIPESCLPQYNEVPNKNGVDSNSCFHSDSYHDDGDQWRSADEACTMCFCHHGNVKCDAVVCPQLSCEMKAMIRPGDCCPTCTNSTSDGVNTSLGCIFNKEIYPAGNRWHPYLPPAGFDRCTVCECHAKTLTVDCTNSCPPLTCPEKLAQRPDEKSCCKVCPPETKSESNRTNEIENKDGESVLTEEEILKDGGCRYRNEAILNGHEWHPNLHSYGPQKCIICNCKDGNVTCRRKRCNKCNQVSMSRRRGQHKGAHQKHIVDECCQQHCRRIRRHQQRHHRMRS